jgi:hypothetical protein
VAAARPERKENPQTKPTQAGQISPSRSIEGVEKRSVFFEGIPRRREEGGERQADELLTESPEKRIVKLTDLGRGDGVGVVDDDDRPGRHDHGHLVDPLQRRQQLLNDRHLRRAANPQHVEVALLVLGRRVPHL